ncbi:MAG: hypothetical protein KC609_17795, partial [Myxococcales bacterium]|nr:hypothetical protein [Myxococcales bacterium]
MKRTVVTLLVMAFALSGTARAKSFGTGSIIIPMDVDYQDSGMFKAYGLVYELLRNDVPIYWVIKQGKTFGSADFTTDAVDFKDSQTVITDHGYRGGPWVIDSADVNDTVKAIIVAWQAVHVTTVHVTTKDFEGDIGRKLVAAPTIAMHADGNQAIARSYMVAAHIPDSTLDPTWPDSSPDMLTPAEIAGTVGVERDGALFSSNGRPRYCQLMTMHWGVGDAEKNPEVVAEVKEFLGFPTHFFAECQAVNAFENIGFFLTFNGFEIGKEQNKVKFVNADSPFAQIDGIVIDVDGIGAWDYLKGGSEPSYDLPNGDSYRIGGITMITKFDTSEGNGDVWMTGYLNGTCAPTEEDCGSLGKVSYLGGHQYDVKLPISDNPKSQGTRLFLNSLFEAPCATDKGQPFFAFTKSADPPTAEGNVTYHILVQNNGLSTATDVEVRDP